MCKKKLPYNNEWTLQAIRNQKAFLREEEPKVRIDGQVITHAIDDFVSFILYNKIFIAKQEGSGNVYGLPKKFELAESTKKVYKQKGIQPEIPQAIIYFKSAFEFLYGIDERGITPAAYTALNHGIEPSEFQDTILNLTHKVLRNEAIKDAYRKGETKCEAYTKFMKALRLVRDYYIRSSMKLNWSLEFLMTL